MKLPKPELLKSGAYRIRLRLDGKNVPIYGKTERECIRNAEAVKASYLVGERIPAKPNDKTLEQIIDEYIEARRAVRSPATIAGYLRIKNNRFKKYMKLSLKNISNWQTVINEEAKNCSPKTVSNAWGLVSAALKYAHIPVPEIALPNKQPNKRPFLLYDQIEAFLSAIKNDPCELSALLALHSMRCSEVIGLDWGSIDLDRRCIIVSGSVVKDERGTYVFKEENKSSAARRTIPIMIPRLYQLLSEKENKTGRVVQEHPHTTYKRINAICRANNLPLVGWHGLRHSFASLAYHLNVPERITMRIGGWDDQATLHKIYTHIAQQDVDKYGEELKNFFQSIYENPRAN